MRRRRRCADDELVLGVAPDDLAGVRRTNGPYPSDIDILSVGIVVYAFHNVGRRAAFVPLACSGPDPLSIGEEPLKVSNPTCRRSPQLRFHPAPFGVSWTFRSAASTTVRCQARCLSRRRMKSRQYRDKPCRRPSWRSRFGASPTATHGRARLWAFFADDNGFALGVRVRDACHFRQLNATTVHVNRATRLEAGFAYCL